MTIKRLNDSWPIKYEVKKSIENEFVQILKWIESQEVPQSVVDEAMFIEKIINYMINNFSEKNIAQKNYFLAVIDLLRLKEIVVNNQNLKLSNVYMSSIDQNLFCFEYNTLKDPVISLLENNLIYQAILIISFYSNLGFGTYEAAGGYEGADEAVKLSYLEFLVTMNVKDVDELKSTLKSLTPEINSGHEVSYSKDRKFVVSEVALELKKLLNSGLESMSKIRTTGLVYGIYSGIIKSDDLINMNLKQKTIVNSNYENMYEELDYLFFQIKAELDSIDSDPILRDILSQGGNEIYSENNKNTVNSDKYKTLIDFLVQVLELSVNDNYENDEFVESVTYLIADCMTHINSDKLISDYKIRLKTFGIEFGPELEVQNPHINADKPKVQWIKKLFTRS